MTRLDILSPRKSRDGKTRWLKIGAAFPRKNGEEGYQCVLDALPLPDEEGRVSLLMSPPKDFGDAPRDTGSYADKRPPANGGGASLDDDIPF